MSFESLTRHTAYIIRFTVSEDTDEWLQPEPSETLHATVKMHVEPRQTPLGRTGGVEEPFTHDVGGTVNDGTMYMLPTDVTAADRVQHVRADCIAAGFADCSLDDVTYRVMQARDGAGRGHHLEIDVRLIGPEAEEVGISG